MSKKEKTMVVIGDTHAHPEHDNSRFTCLGNYLLETRPDIILQTGDFADMPSLSSYDKGTKGFEGRRYQRDIASANDALHRMFKPITQHNQRMAKNRKSRYRPRTVMVLGNHDGDRIDRVTNIHPELDGTISIKDIQYGAFFGEIHPYKEIVVVEGFAVSHFMPSGVMGRPIGGENVARSLLAKTGMSCIVGHNHLLDMSVRTRADGQKCMAISAGWYGHPEMVEGWNKNTAQLWWNGIIVLRGVGNGWAEEVQTISQEHLMRKYG